MLAKNPHRNALFTHKQRRDGWIDSN